MRKDLSNIPEEVLQEVGGKCLCGGTVKPVRGTHSIFPFDQFEHYDMYTRCNKCHSEWHETVMKTEDGWEWASRSSIGVNRLAEIKNKPMFWR